MSGRKRVGRSSVSSFTSNRSSGSGCTPQGEPRISFEGVTLGQGLKSRTSVVRNHADEVRYRSGGGDYSEESKSECKPRCCLPVSSKVTDSNNRGEKKRAKRRKTDRPDETDENDEEFHDYDDLSKEEQLIMLRDHPARERRRQSKIPDTVSIAEDPFLEPLCNEAGLEPDKPADQLSRSVRRSMVRKLSINVMQKRNSIASNAPTELFNEPDNVRANVATYMREKINSVGNTITKLQDPDCDSSDYESDSVGSHHWEVEEPIEENAKRSTWHGATREKNRDQFDQQRASTSSAQQIEDIRLEQFRKSYLGGIRKGSCCPNTVLDPNASTGINTGVTMVMAIGSLVGCSKISTAPSNIRASFSGLSHLAANHSGISITPTSHSSHSPRTSVNPPRLSKVSDSSADDQPVYENHLMVSSRTTRTRSSTSGNLLASGKHPHSNTSIGYVTRGDNDFGSIGPVYSNLSDYIPKESAKYRRESIFSLADETAQEATRHSISSRSGAARRLSIVNRTIDEAPKMTSTGTSQYPLPGSKVKTTQGGTYKTTRAANNLISEDEIAEEIQKAVDTVNKSKKVKRFFDF